MSIRVRLSFDEMVPGYSKKIWFLFDASSCRLVADLEHLIQRKFDFQRNSSLFLYSDDYLLPAQEKIDLIRDGDIIRVERQGNLWKEREKRSRHDDEDIRIRKKRKCNEQKRVTTQEEKYKRLKQLKDKVNQVEKHSTKPTKKDRTDSVSGRKSKMTAEKPCNTFRKTTKKHQNTAGKWLSKTENNVQEGPSSLETSGSWTSSFESTSELSSELSLESSTNTSSSTKEEVVRRKNKAVSNNAGREKIGNGLKQNRRENMSQVMPSGYHLPLTSSSALSSSNSTLSSSSSLCGVPKSYNSNNVSFLLSHSSESSMVSSSPSSSTKDSVDQAKKKFILESSENTPSISSTSKALSTDAQEETTSDQLVTKNQKHKNHLNGKEKEKSLLKSKKRKAKISSSTSAEGQVETPKSQFKTQNQKEKDDLNAKVREKSLPRTKKTKVKILDSSTSALSAEGYVESEIPKSKTQKGNNVNAKTKEKSLPKNKKTRAKILDSSTSGLSAEGHAESAIITKCKTQKGNDNVDEKTKEKPLPKSKKTKPKILDSLTSDLSTEGKNKTLKNQPEFPQQVSQATKIVKRSYSPVTGVNNSHIRFDSDEENEDMSALKHDAQNHGCNDASNTATNGLDMTEVGNEVTNSTKEHPLSNPCIPASEQMKTALCNPLDHGGVMENSTGHDAPPKNIAVDYNTYPSLQGPPRIGDRIAYKVLELSASYTPEMSNYKEGAVLGYDPVTNEVQLELTDDSLSKPLGDGNISTKFELIYEDEEDDNSRPPVVLERKVSVVWTSMVDPRLITS